MAKYLNYSYPCFICGLIVFGVLCCVGASMADDGFQAMSEGPLPSAGSQNDASPAETVIVCPHCCNATSDLKSFDVLNLIFLYFYVAWNYQRVVACAACMRGVLVKRIFFSIPAANLLFPIAAFSYVLQIIETTSWGHSDPAAAELHRMTTEEQFARRQAKINLQRPGLREAIFLLVVVLLIAAFSGGYYALQNAEDPKIDGKTANTWIDELRSPNKETRLQAATRLGDLGPQAKFAVPSLQDLALHDENQWVRTEAYRALRSIDPQSAHGIPIPGIKLPGIND